MTRQAKTVEVIDPFGVASDAAMPSLAAALHPATARAEFKRGLTRLSGETGRISVRAIRVTRYKPGKRCVIEYDLKLRRPDAADERLTVVGKVRARRFGNEAYRLLDALWNAGFHDTSADGICVPEPVGVLPPFQMWLQRKVPGRVASEPLEGAGGLDLARRIADAICKVHRCGVPTNRAHSMADELRILRACLAHVSQARPELASRVQRVREACERLGTLVPPAETRGIHRDFYPAQVLVNGTQLYLIDFDLYCQGDP